MLSLPGPWKDANLLLLPALPGSLSGSKLGRLRKVSQKKGMDDVVSLSSL